MDELLRDFLTETVEHIEGAENQLVMFEKNPSDASLISSIFRLVHTIKGTSSFLGLNRLEGTAHAAETLISDMRDGAPATKGRVSLILEAIDQIRGILAEIEEHGAEVSAINEDLLGRISSYTEDDAAAAGDTPATSADAAGGALAEPPVAAAHDGAREESLPEGADDDVEPGDDLPAAREGREPTAAARPGKNEARQPAAAGTAAKVGSQETIRVTVNTIERIMQLVSELVLTRNQLLEITRNREADLIKSPLQRLSTVTSDLQDAVMRARMQPVGRVFSAIPRLIRELSSDLGKKIQLITEGAETELDRQLIDVIRDPVTHLIRNCADHGIEPPHERLAAGKSETGTIRVSASHEAGQITIEISDDGRGLNLELIKKKLIENGRRTEQEINELSPHELYQFIFDPGFSTAKKLTNVSGRGVGMDVVRSNIESIGGSVILSSQPGLGSRFVMRIPLTLAIAPALIVEVAGQRFALPQHSVVEVVGAGGSSSHRIELLQGSLVLKLREHVIPVLELRSILNLPSTSESSATPGADDQECLVAILRVGGEAFGVILDAVTDVQEIVVKPMSATLSHLNVFSGHTILGDGSVVLILDPSGVSVSLGIEKSARRAAAAGDKQLATEKTSYVIFRAGRDALKVLPLSLVSRIENVRADQLQHAQGQILVQRLGRLMPIIPVSSDVDLFGREEHPVLIVSVAGAVFGLVVDEIIDVFEGEIADKLGLSSDGTIATSILNDQAVDLIDIASYVRAAFPERGWTRPRAPTGIQLVGSDPYVTDVLGKSLTVSGYQLARSRSLDEALLAIDGPSAVQGIVVDLDDHTIRRELAAYPELGMSQTARVIGIARDPMSAQEQLAGGGLTIIDRFDRESLLHELSSLSGRPTDWRAPPPLDRSAVATSQPAADAAPRAAASQALSCFTLFVGDEIFGLSVCDTQTIFKVQRITAVPRSPDCLFGLINIRGKVVMAVSLRKRLGLPHVDVPGGGLAIGIEYKGENYALLVDRVGDVLSLDPAARIQAPSHIDAKRSRFMKELYRVNDLLVPLIDIGTVLDLTAGNRDSRSRTNASAGGSEIEAES